MTTDVNPPIGALSDLKIDLNSQQGRKQLLIFLNQLWLRTGGGTDLIADIGGAQTTQDGGNRSLIRRYRDQIDEIAGLHQESRRPKRYEDDIAVLGDQIAQLKRQKTGFENLVNDLSGVIATLKKQNRTLENKLNELETRIDSGV